MTPPVFVLSSDDLADATVGGTVHVSGAEGRHAATVMRMGVGESVGLVDGCGRRIAGEVTAVIDRQALEVSVRSVTDEPRPRPRVVVVQALAKGDRSELAVELLTEIGVDEIVPWSAANSVAQWRGDRAERSWRRWSDAASAAGKQSRRATFPVVARLASTADVCARVAEAALATVLHESATIPICDVGVPSDGEVVIVVGPEGGLSPDELVRFAEAGAMTVRLGPTVLRTSSAGMAAVAALLARTSRWADDRPAGPTGMEG